MELLRDAKNHYNALLSCEGARPYARRICDSLSSLIHLNKEIEEMRNVFFGELPPESLSLPKVDLKEFLIIEDCVLAVADYLLTCVNISEFSRVMEYEIIRQSLLGKIALENESIAEAVCRGEPRCLPRHTPMGF